MVSKERREEVFREVEEYGLALKEAMQDPDPNTHCNIFKESAREYQEDDDEVIRAIGYSMELIKLLVEYYEEGASDPSFYHDLVSHSGELFKLVDDLNF